MLNKNEVDHGTERIFLFTRDEDWVLPALKNATELQQNRHEAIESFVSK